MNFKIQDNSRQGLEQVEQVVDLEYTFSLSHVKELFPDYGDGFILECLKYYKNDAETVIMKILEDTLDEKLKKLDISMGIQSEVPVSGVLKDRKNIFDNDKFDIFSRKVDSRNIVFGKKE
jgi:activating signal cointegrator complex subunit 2